MPVCTQKKERLPENYYLDLLPMTLIRVWLTRLANTFTEREVKVFT